MGSPGMGAAANAKKNWGKVRGKVKTMSGATMTVAAKGKRGSQGSPRPAGGSPEMGSPGMGDKALAGFLRDNGVPPWVIKKVTGNGIFKTMAKKMVNKCVDNPERCANVAMKLTKMVKLNNRGLRESPRRRPSETSRGDTPETSESPRRRPSERSRGDPSDTSEYRGRARRGGGFQGRGNGNCGPFGQVRYRMCHDEGGDCEIVTLCPLDV